MNIRSYSDEQKLPRACAIIPTTKSPKHYPADAGSDEINPLVAIFSPENIQFYSKLFNRSSIFLSKRDHYVALRHSAICGSISQTFIGLILPFG